MRILESEPILKKIIYQLKTKHGCHTAFLYGSRARGEATKTSDYDVVGICRKGTATRIARKVNGVFWDIFIYPEKDLKKLSDQHLSWRDAKVLFETDGYGHKLVKRIEKLIATPFKPAPKYEIDVLKAWSMKQLERIIVGDVHGHYRRNELLSNAVSDYFTLRRKRFWGPKAGLQWIEEKDRSTYRLFARAYSKPTDFKLLRALVRRVYRV